MEMLPEELSIDMRNCLEIGRALIGWPSLMVYDEPTSGLASISEKQVLDLIICARDIHKISLLYGTKEMHEIAYLANHFAIKDQTGEVSVCRGDAGQSERMRVRELEEGRVAFFGNPYVFTRSSLPVVTQVTCPAVITRRIDSNLADPWSQTRKNQSGLRFGR
jgi:ABC-type multidrug transport system ATPase subunit